MRPHILKGFDKTEIDFESDIEWKVTPSISFYSLAGRTRFKGELYEAKLSIRLDEKENRYNVVNFDLSNYKDKFTLMLTHAKDRSGEYNIK